MAVGGTVVGQHYRHATVWSRLNIIAGVSPKVSVLGEFFYRTQNSFRQSEFNPFDAALMEGARLGINYRINKHWSVYAAPFWYFHSHALLGKDSDYDRPPVREFRYAVAPEWRHDWKKTTLQLRLMQEYRTFEATPPTHRTRVRLQARYQLSGHDYLVASNEIFYILPSLNAAPIFDMYRPLFGYGHNFGRHVALEVGYQFNYRRRRTRTEFDEEHTILLTGIVRLGQ